MTAPRTRIPRGPLAAVRWGGACVAALALFALFALTAVGSSGPARAASTGDSYNQMTGVGLTASAITVKWTDGLLNAQNQPITGSSSTDGTPEPSSNSDREAYAAGHPTTSPLSFMYADFKNLQVTVSQTQNITHQGITVKWKGGEPSSAGAPLSNFLQIMECYGDSASGPSPEDCEYGSRGMLGTTINPTVGDRAGYSCGAGATPSANPADTPPGPYGDPSMGCDTYEPAAQTPSHCVPGATGNFQCTAPYDYFSVPFVPADSTTPIYQQQNLPQAFDQFNSNEVQVAYTAADGTGERQFETLTGGGQSPLGCGEAESNGQTRNCWLVIVPRGTYEPNGFQVSPTASGLYLDGKFLDSSPLSAGNWAQRIQIHLDYAPLASNCPPTVLPTATVGTQVIFRAVSSWQHALNQAAKCSRVYSYTASTENESTSQLQGAGTGGAGLAFTTIPIGSEITRHGGKPPTLPKILYAPVAVTALDLGFNINEASYVTAPVKLTPALVAKALTQAYLTDLPDYYPDFALPGPAWSKGNPLNITVDPAFQKLNPTSEIPVYESTHPIAPLRVGDLSADNQRVWQWVQSDAATASWLDGGKNTGDPVSADPDYVKLRLGKAPASDGFPEAYLGTIECPQVVTNINECPKDLNVPPGKDPYSATKMNTEDMLPVESNFDQAAATVLAASDSGLTRVWDTTAKAPNGNSGWWAAVGSEQAGQTFMFAMNDMPDLASYGLISAALCNPSGATCVQPSVSNVTAALKSATKDSAGLLQVLPSKVPAGAYPLVDVVYAAVALDQPAATLGDYADLIAYAAGQGQTTGSAPGDLPPGYLPLPAGLQAQAEAVVRQLRTLASPSPTPTHSTTQSATHSPTQTQSTQPTPGTTPTSSTTPAPTAGPSATPTLTVAGLTPSTSPSAQGPVILGPSASLAAATTPPNNVGSIRLALVVVLIIGAAGALGGGVLRYARVPKVTRSRRRPGGM